MLVGCGGKLTLVITPGHEKARKLSEVSLARGLRWRAVCDRDG